MPSHARINLNGPYRPGANRRGSSGVYSGMHLRGSISCLVVILLMPALLLATAKASAVSHTGPSDHAHCNDSYANEHQSTANDSQLACEDSLGLGHAHAPSADVAGCNHGHCCQCTGCHDQPNPIVFTAPSQRTIDQPLIDVMAICVGILNHDNVPIRWSKPPPSPSPANQRLQLRTIVLLT